MATLLSRLAPALASLTLGLVAVIGGVATPAAADDGSPACYGHSCTSLDPIECADDAITVARMDFFQQSVGGNLEMRYSRSCNASWARYSPYPERSDIGMLLGMGGVVDVRPTIWVEGEPSQYPVGGTGNGWNDPSGSIWTGMVDGSVKNCMGIDFRTAVPSDTAGADWGSTHSTHYDEFKQGPCA